MHDFLVDEVFVATANAVQLHDEARGDVSAEEWSASFTFVDGRWVYRVDRDDVDRGAVEAAIAAHVPDPDHGVPVAAKRLRVLAKKATLTAAEQAEALKLLLSRIAGEGS